MRQLYAVAPASDTLTALGLEVYTDADLAVLWEPCLAPPEHGPAELLAVARTVRRIWEFTPMLPMRFGSVAADRTELETMVGARGEHWRTRLAAVAGCSELVVHLPEAAPDPVPRRSAPERPRGADYLRERAARLAADEHRAREVAGLLEGYAVETARLRDGERISALVPDDLLAGARQALGAAGLRATGPWPPFSFSEEDP